MVLHKNESVKIFGKSWCYDQRSKKEKKNCFVFHELERIIKLMKKDNGNILEEITKLRHANRREQERYLIKLQLHSNRSSTLGFAKFKVVLEVSGVPAINIPFQKTGN